MWAFLKRISLSQWIIVATILGIIVGYLDYTADTGRLRPDELVQRSDQVADDNLRRGVLSATGEKFKRTIQP